MRKVALSLPPRRSQKIDVDERDNDQALAEVARKVNLDTPTLEAADHSSQRSIVCAPEGEVGAGRDHRDLRPARGIMIALLLSLVFWVLFAMGLW